MQRNTSFLAIGLLATASLFSADNSPEESMANAASLAESCITDNGLEAPRAHSASESSATSENRTSWYIDCSTEVENIRNIVSCMHNNQHPEIADKCLGALMGQRIAQITVRTLAKLLRVQNATSAQLLEGLLSEKQTADTDCLIRAHTSSLLAQVTAIESQAHTPAVQHALYLMGMACHLRESMRARSAGAVDKESGFFHFGFNVAPSHWIDLLHICSCVELCGNAEESSSLWIKTVATNPTAQMVLWGAALGTAGCTNAGLAPIIFDVLPKEEKIKKAYLATMIAHADWERLHGDQYHEWIQRAIVEGGSWRSMLDMQKNRPAEDKKALLYWYARAQQAGWVADHEKQQVIDTLYTDVDSIETAVIGAADFRADIKKIITHETTEQYARVDDVDNVATEYEMDLLRAGRMMTALENEDEENSEFVIVRMKE